MNLKEDPDGRIAHVIKLCEEYPYDSCVIEDCSMYHTPKYHNRFTGEYDIDDDLSRIHGNGPRSLTLSYNEAVRNDLMVIALLSGLNRDNYFDVEKTRSLRNGFTNGYAFMGWCINVEYLKSVIG